MIRVAVLPFVFIFISAFCHAENSRQPMREWSDAKGKFKVTARCVSIDEKAVKLMTQAGKEVTVQINKLSDTDKRYVEGSRIVEDDVFASSVISYHMDRITVSPLGVREVLEATNDKNSRSPLIPFGLGLTVIATDGDYEKAEEQFNLAARRITEIRKIVPNAHTSTLVAAANNKAICQLKQLKGDSAIKTLAYASDVKGVVPFVTYHNATLIMEVLSAGGRTKFKVTDSNRKKLSTMIGSKIPEAPGINVPKRYLFSMDFDKSLSFDEIAEVIDGRVSKETSSDSLNKPAVAVVEGLTELQNLQSQGYVRQGQGSGFYVGKNLIATNRHVAEPSFLSRTAGGDITYVVRQFRSDNTERVTIARKIAVHQDARIDLALLSGDDGGAMSLPICDAAPPPGEEITVLGFPQVDRFGESITASTGVVNKKHPDQPILLTDANINAGNSGGPCVDFNANVCGIAFAEAILGQNEQNRGLLVDPTELKRFILRVQPGVQLPFPSQSRLAARSDVVKAVSNSVLLIEIWAKPSAVDASRNANAAGSRLSDQLLVSKLLPDLNCMSCSGKGFIPCRNCRRGLVTAQKKSVGFRDPYNGNVFFNDENVNVRCEVCGGQWQQDCGDCQNGVLPLR